MSAWFLNWRTFSGAADKEIRSWSRHKTTRTFKGHTDVVRGLAVIPDIGFASCSNDGWEFLYLTLPVLSIELHYLQRDPRVDAGGRYDSHVVGTYFVRLYPFPFTVRRPCIRGRRSKRSCLERCVRCGVREFQDANYMFRWRVHSSDNTTCYFGMGSLHHAQRGYRGRDQ